MEKISKILIIFLFIYSSKIIAQEKVIEQATEKNDTSIEVTTPEEQKDKKKSVNVNIDTKLMYGMYNNIFTSFSLIQNFKKFTYQLNSDFKRSDDYNYKNTSFYEGAVGFTAKADILEAWKLTPELEFNFESHGMYKNQYYRTEEKDTIDIKLKNEYLHAPSRWGLNIGVGQYIHRLEDNNTNNINKNDFFRINGEIGWEYIWSAANELSYNSKVAYYNYLNNSTEDIYVYNEFSVGFKILEYVKIAPGIIYVWNKDDGLFKGKYGGHLLGGKISLSSAGLKKFSIEVSYKYDLRPFNPENVYFKQKFIMPDYSLYPGKVHHADLKAALDLKFSSKNKAYIKSVKIKVTGKFEENDHFYNYYSLPENVMSAKAISAMFYNIRLDASINTIIINVKLKLGFYYEYSHYYSNENITYRPEHLIGAVVNFNTKWFGIEWENKYMSKMHVNPDNNVMLDNIFVGSVSLQVKVLETFSLYAKVDNMYNNKYSIRYGYPEPGVIFLGGIRIAF